MRERICRVRKLFCLLALGIILMSVGVGKTGLCAQGMTLPDDGSFWDDGSSQFSFGQLPMDSSMDIRAKLVTSDRSVYQVEVTVENFGTDWEGTVRLSVGEDYRVPAAYDTVLSLPQGSTKQFSVKIPKNNRTSDNRSGNVRISMWNKKSVKVAEREFDGLLVGAMDAFHMGILSDNYSALTYLDLGGETIYYSGESNRIRLVELHQDNLRDKLDTLTFLVIDHFSTDVLTQEDLDALDKWVANGGILIIGTGTYAEDTLSGLDGLVDITCRSVDISGKNDGYYLMDLSELPWAQLAEPNGWYNERYQGGLTRSYGYGAFAVMNYSLEEMGKLHTSGNNDFDYMVQDILNMITNCATGYYGNNSYRYDYEDMARRLLGTIGNNSRGLKFGVLRFLIIVYVIFVGPVLYLILRAAKKRDLYWVFVPVSALVGIVLVFFAGRGFEITDTRVYSVTVTDLDEKAKARSFMHCYNASHREWNLKISDRYEYAGPVVNTYYYYSDSTDDKYSYHIRRDGDGLFFGVAPESIFEDCYFTAGGASAEEDFEGDVLCEGIYGDWLGLCGEITNATNHDFAYVAVIADDTLFVYDELPVGQSINLSNEEAIHTSYQSGNIWSSYLHQFMDKQYRDKKVADPDAAAALGIGISAVYTQPDSSKVVVVCVAKDWSKVVDDHCSETAYGCLYKIQ